MPARHVAVVRELDVSVNASDAGFRRAKRESLTHVAAFHDQQKPARLGRRRDRRRRHDYRVLIRRSSSGRLDRLADAGCRRGGGCRNVGRLRVHDRNASRRDVVGSESGGSARTCLRFLGVDDRVEIRGRFRRRRVENRRNVVRGLWLKRRLRRRHDGRRTPGRCRWRNDLAEIRTRRDDGLSSPLLGRRRRGLRRRRDRCRRRRRLRWLGRRRELAQVRGRRDDRRRSPRRRGRGRRRLRDRRRRKIMLRADNRLRSPLGLWRRRWRRHGWRRRGRRQGWRWRHDRRRTPRLGRSGRSLGGCKSRPALLAEGPVRVIRCTARRTDGLPSRSPPAWRLQSRGSG